MSSSGSKSTQDKAERLAWARALINDAKRESDIILNDAKTKAESIAAQSKEIMIYAKKEAESILAGAAEESKKLKAEQIAFIQDAKNEAMVKLDVGGVRFTTTLTTLQRLPDTMIGCMFSGRHALPKSEDGYFFIDRDGTHFRHILNFLRLSKSYKVEVGGADVRELQRECEPLCSDIWRLCCWTACAQRLMCSLLEVPTQAHSS
ncbi:BTB/POZ protein [Ochromonadaceae sp. CCMP2298]|nr:BTB/POZ protein [Ochromonadaceae sp. CCMP2298]